MFIISNGMPKSGSTLLMRYAKYLLIEQCGIQGQNAFHSWIKNGPIGGIGDFSWDGWENRIVELENISLEDGPFVLKTHMPREKLLYHIKANQNIKIIYSIRDPRDIILSLIDHGERSREKGDKTFSEILDIDTALQYTKYWCKVATDWIEYKNIHVFRYENLVESPQIEIERLSTILSIKPNIGLIEQIIRKENEEREYGKFQFNKGLKTRYKDEMIETQIKKINNCLNKYITTLGYEL